jgi:hypothetical protein
MSCANQDEQSLASWADQENQTFACWDALADMSSNNAQSIDDKSSRNENLQSMLNTMQCNNTDETAVCKEELFPLGGRSENLYLLNSKIGNFRDKTYECDYKLSSKDSTFRDTPIYKDRYDKVVPFHVKYNPATQNLFVSMPVKFMGPNDEDVYDEPGTKSAIVDDAFKERFKTAYEHCVQRVWSSAYSNLYLHLNAIASFDKSCYNWSSICPVSVETSIEETDASPSYKVFYVPREDYVDSTWADAVAFSEQTLNDVDVQNQNVFAHEFGHQIGLDDEYAIKYHKALIDGGNRKIGFVYWDEELKENDVKPGKPILKAYERTEGVRWYTLPREKFNHDGEDYSAEEMIFDVNGREINGFVLKKGNAEVIGPLDDHQNPVPVVATDIDGVQHQAVYFYDEGKWDVELEVPEKAGPRAYDLEMLSANRTNGARINHNGNEYSVGKRKDDDDDDFFYLVDSSGEIKDRALDGTYTTHFDMVKEHFGEEYALENATMYNGDELGFQSFVFSNEEHIMNVGNEAKAHHYLPFLKGMVSAIQEDYPVSESEEAPNMEKDWKIE